MLSAPAHQVLEESEDEVGVFPTQIQGFVEQIPGDENDIHLGKRGIITEVMEESPKTCDHVRWWIPSVPEMDVRYDQIV